MLAHYRKFKLSAQIEYAFFASILYVIFWVLPDENSVSKFSFAKLDIRNIFSKDYLYWYKDQFSCLLWDY